MTVAATFVVLLITFAETQLSLATSEETTRSVTYNICPKGRFLKTQQQGHITARSHLECTAACTAQDDCTGVNVYPGEEAGQVRCTLTREVVPGLCDDLTAAASPLCFHTQKKAPLWCRNDGTLNGTKCVCPIQYSGLACERFVRDCSEAFDNGHAGEGEGELEIQPIEAPASFKVRCQYSWGGATALLLHSTISSFNQDFPILKAGIGNNPMVIDYFVGLDTLHHFTSQASYELNFNTNKNNNLYDNFTVGPETSSYAISFDGFRPTSVYGDGFSVSPPLKFSANGHDTNGCYAAKGVPGWYGANCTGYPTFTNGNFDWPDGNGGVVSVSALIVKFVRTSPYYDD